MAGEIPGEAIPSGNRRQAARGARSRLLFIFALVFAGEMIFSLPFHTARFFRPTLLQVFGFTNTQLGDIFAVYGITAMLAYFPGGAIADRFSARSLMTFSLAATAAGGLYMSSFPGTAQMAALYGYWGITTIFLFWAAMIRATREWGGEHAQGKAFGILDGGRGLVAAAVAGIAVALLSHFLAGDGNLVSAAQREEGFRAVILFYSAVTLAAGVMTWFCLPVITTATHLRKGSINGILEVLGRPLVWAQAAVIICAYCGYKGLDNYSLYAVQVLGMNEVDGARFTVWAAYTRPVACVLAGVLADRFLPSRILGAAFGVLVISFMLLSAANPAGPWLLAIYANIFISFFGVFALRGVYFALLQETRTPRHLTGTTVGIVSFIGYTPEIFFGPVTGRILDAAPGIAGHRNYFMFLASVMMLGLLSVAILVWLNARAKKQLH